MKKLGLLVMALAILSLVGCASVDSPTLLSANSVGSKVGKASGKIWLGLFGNADIGQATAAKNGGITKIATVDVRTSLGILGLWVDYETTVTGE